MPAADETTVPEVTFAEFRERAGIDARRIPIEGTVETTFRCNLNCVHCYVNEPAGAKEIEEQELSLERLKQLVDEIVEEGCLFVLFTGGEVLVRPDFPELYLYARSRGLLVTIFTNGTMITDRIADLFAEHTPETIEITLYGRTRETYERLTGLPGSYDRCLRGIHLLKERGLPLQLKTVAVTLNKHEIGDMQRFAEEELGLAFKFDAMINPRIDCSQSPLAVRLQPEEVVALDLQDPKRVASWQEFAAQFNGPVHSPEQSDAVYHCGGASTVLPSTRTAR